MQNPMTKLFSLRPRIGVALLVMGALILTAGAAQAQQTVPSNLTLVQRVARAATEEALNQLELEPGCAVTVLATTPHEANQLVKQLVAEQLAQRGCRVKVVGTTAEVDTARAASAAAEETSGPPITASARAQAARAAARRNEAATDTTGVALEPEPQPEPEPEEQPVAAVEPARPVLEHADLTAYQVLPQGVLPAGDIIDVEVLELGVRYPEVGRRLMVGPVHFTRVAGAYVRLSHLNGPGGETKSIATGENRYWDRLSGRQRALAEGAAYPYTPPDLNAPGLGRYIEPAVVVGIVGSLIYLFYANQN